MNKLKANWPSLVALIATTLAPVLVKEGWLTADHVGLIGVIAGPLFTKLVHHLQAPS